MFTSWAEEMAQWGRNLPHKHEDPSLDPQNLQKKKKLGVAVYAVSLVLGRQGQNSKRVSGG